MLSKIYNIFLLFKKDCFSRRIPFEYFCIVILSLMIITEPTGVSAMVRDLFLQAAVYDALIHFFKSKAYFTDNLCFQWARIVESHSCCFTYKGCNILIGDHTKVSKEGRRMPGCKSHHQDSENFGKAPNIIGHHIGTIGILTGTLSKLFCTLIYSRIHEGTEKVQEWMGKEVLSRTARLAVEAIEIAKNLKRSSYLILDRDFWTVNVIGRIIEYNQTHENRIHLVGRAKNRILSRRELTEEEKAENKKLHKQGRPRKYTPEVYIDEWFQTRIDEFREIVISGGKCVRSLRAVMPWNGLVLCFVLSIAADGTQSIFYSTDLSLSAREMLILYELRFKIEESFKGLKHIVNGFNYRFWVKDLMKLTKFNSKIRFVNVSRKLKIRIINCLDRIERMINFAGIALGILQILTLEAGKGFSQNVQQLFYQRTYLSDGSLSVGQVKTFISEVFPLSMDQEPNCPLTKIIRKYQTGLRIADFFKNSA